MILQTQSRRGNRNKLLSESPVTTHFDRPTSIQDTTKRTYRNHEEEFKW